MMDKNVFLETLKEVSEIVRTSATPMAEEDILSYFKDMTLSDEQKKQILEYVMTPQSEQEPGTDKEDEGEVVDTTQMPKSLSMYMEELKNLNEYSDEETNEMCLALLGGDSDMVAKLSEAMLTEVAALAADYASERVDVEDLIQEGNLAVFLRLGELMGLGEECGYDVMEELTESVNEAMKNYVGFVTGEDDEKHAIAGKANLLNDAIAFLTQQKGREPDIYELSDYTHLGIEEISDILEFTKKK